jgi:2,4-dienoyl-CoA reductase-like NADH-dependent reductase (Old Yellow Enzyme family)
LAAWTKKVTGRPTIAVGSIGLEQDLFETFANEGCSTADLDKLMLMLDRGDFDLVALGRALIANPDWPEKVRNNRNTDIVSYRSEMLTSLT